MPEGAESADRSVLATSSCTNASRHTPNHEAVVEPADMSPSHASSRARTQEAVWESRRPGAPGRAAPGEPAAGEATAESPADVPSVDRTSSTKRLRSSRGQCGAAVSSCAASRYSWRMLPCSARTESSRAVARPARCGEAHASRAADPSASNGRWFARTVIPCSARGGSAAPRNTPATV